MRDAVRSPQFWWRSLLVVVGVVGLLADDHRIIYFTVQSNVVVVGYAVAALHRTARTGSPDAPAPRLRGAVTLWILITGVVAHVLLNDGANPLPGLTDPDPDLARENWSAFAVHYVVPVMVLVDWLAFGPHRQVRWRDLPLWILYPLGYGLACVARAVLLPGVPDRYPYFFLDPTGHGYGWVAGQFVVLAVEFSVLGALVVGLDRLAAATWGRTRVPAAPPGS